MASCNNGRLHEAFGGRIMGTLERRLERAGSENATFAYVGDRDDEISLVDLWLVLRKRWLWLLGGLLLGASAAVAYIVLTDTAYESRARVQIGKISGKEPIEDITALAVRLIDQHGRELGNGIQKRIPYLQEAVEEPRASNILKMVTVGRSSEEASNFLARIVSTLVERHERMYANAIGPLEQRLSVVDGQIALLTAQAKELGDLIDRLKESGPAQASLVAVERGRVYAGMTELERDRVSLLRQISDLRNNQTRVLVPVKRLEAPVTPMKTIATASGVVLGLVLGLSAVFIREFFANVRRTKTDAYHVRNDLARN